jgi:hypothetical protein
MLKEFIKSKSEEQKQLKKARKTGPYEIIKSEFGYINYKAMPERVKEAWIAAGKVQENKIKITAALNLYHELKGSEYRHNIPSDSHYQWLYKAEYKKLKEEAQKRASPNT